MLIEAEQAAETEGYLEGIIAGIRILPESQGEGLPAGGIEDSS